MQDTLRLAWHARIGPPIQSRSAADLCSAILLRELGPQGISLYTFVDFCAGAGGPTPRIEHTLNASAYAQNLPRADFVLTDLHPHPQSWARLAKKSVDRKLHYVEDSVDASKVDTDLIQKLLLVGSTNNTGSTIAGAKRAELDNNCSSTGTSSARITRSTSRRLAMVNTPPSSDGHSLENNSSTKDKGIFRIFNLAFHHFPDDLACAILKNCVETNTPFVLFELQDRSLTSFLSIILLGLGVFVNAPYFAWKWRAWDIIIFTYFIPIIPFVVVFDGFVSSLRTRTRDEVGMLLKKCGAEGADGWTLKDGREQFLWPCGYLNWVVGVKERF